MVQAIPLYSCIAVSLSFSLSMALADMMNLHSESFADMKLPLTSRGQVHALLGGSVVMGLCFGIGFSLSIDAIHDIQRGNHLDRFLPLERHLLVIGALSGGIVGLVSWAWRIP